MVDIDEPPLKKELARRYHIPIPKELALPISYNVAPSQKVLTIRFNPETKERRSLDALQWGLVPYRAKDPKITYKTINGRVETVDTALSYWRAFKKRRCLIPADGFYEWKKGRWRKDPLLDRDEGRFALRWWPRSPRVNSPKNNDPDLIRPFCLLQPFLSAAALFVCCSPFC